jgi:hypothetical protein
MALWEYIGAWASTTKWLYHFNWWWTDVSGNWFDLTPTNISWAWWILWSWSASLNWTNAYFSWSFTNLSIFTIIFFIKPTNNPSSSIYSKVFSFSTWATDTTSIDFSYDHVSSAYRTAFSIRNTADTFFPAKINTTLVWWNKYMIWVTFDWTTLRTYLNWNPEWTATFTWTLTTTWLLNVWRYQTWSQYFNWLIDEWIIENRAWTSQEMKKYYTFSKWLYWII